MQSSENIVKSKSKGKWGKFSLLWMLSKSGQREHNSYPALTEFRYIEPSVIKNRIVLEQNRNGISYASYQRYYCRISTKIYRNNLM